MRVLGQVLALVAICVGGIAGAVVGWTGHIPAPLGLCMLAIALGVAVHLAFRGARALWRKLRGSA